MKPAAILVLARFYSRLPAAHLRSLQALWPAALLIGVPAALVLAQPDLGTALMITFGGVTVMFLAGLPLWWFLGTGGVIAAALPVLYTQRSEEHTSELQSLMRISYAVFCLKKKI